MPVVRTAATLLAVAAVASGCGSGQNKPARTSPPKPATTAPQYTPSAHHANRPPGSVYDDEIGENILTARRSRVTELFGPPAASKGSCIRYRIVRQPKKQWQFCFKGQKMTAAAVVP